MWKMREKKNKESRTLSKRQLQCQLIRCNFNISRRLYSFTLIYFICTRPFEHCEQNCIESSVCNTLHWAERIAKKKLQLRLLSALQKRNFFFFIYIQEHDRDMKRSIIIYPDWVGPNRNIYRLVAFSSALAINNVV